MCIICAVLKRERERKQHETAVKPAKFDRWSVKTTRKNASTGKITEKKKSGKSPQLINTKKEKKERGGKIT